MIINNKKGESMKKLKELFRSDEKEINEEVTKLILGEIDNANYSIDHLETVTLDDIKAAREANNIRLDNKKAKAEIIKNVAQALGITVTSAVALVSIIYTAKYYNFDVAWMNKIYDFKDSINVIDPKSFNQVGKNRENHKRMLDGLMNKRIG